MNLSIYDEDADFYDIAFSWDVGDEVDWLLERLGKDCRRILEPACGSGRMFPAFARRGVEVTGVEISEAMVRRARARMSREGLPEPRILVGDMADFELEEPCDGAICPINTFGYLLTPEKAASHLDCVARHLVPGGKYLLQADLADTRNYTPLPIDETSKWEMERDGVTVRATVAGLSYDPETGIETQKARYEALSGPDKGKVVDEEHEMLLWSWPGWKDLVDRSPFTQVGAYSGRKGWPRVKVGPELEHTRLSWHELAKG